MIVDNFINGEFVPCSKLIHSYEPATGKVWAQIPDSDEKQINLAVAAAKNAFPEWSQLSADQRSKFLLKVADILESRLVEFAAFESRDQGKPVWLTTAVDIPRAVLNFRHFAHTIPHQLSTSSFQPEFGTLNYTSREPIGVAALISPWNLPLYLLSFKLAPALMCGNTVIAKPSELTSVTAFMLCQIFREVGLPAGVVNMVFGTGVSAGEPLVQHPQVQLISFTGSTAVGRHIAQVAAPALKKLSLELGGKNASLIFADCDIDQCVTTMLRSAFVNQGQVCLCTSRVFVQQPIYEEFLKKFVEATRNLKVGCPKVKENFLGALNSSQHLQKVRRYVGYALEDGGTVVCGEGIDKLDLSSELSQGYFMRPTIITGLKDDSRCMQEEIFGPVTVVVPFTTEDEVVQRANCSCFGLCASVWTSNLGVAHRVARELKVGTVWTNCWLVRDLDMPFGGVKSSGLGREGTQESLEFYTEIKTVCTKIE